jgi:endonuclease/exonuclease/phosphatase family metal-dependent hydrolase
MPHDIPFVGTIDSGFGYTATSAVDTSLGITRGRPHGGVCLLYRCSAFQQVLVLQCNNPRICGIKISTSDKSLVILSVYLPTNSAENLQMFTDCLSAISAIIEENGVNSVMIVGDFNAEPGELFYSELMNVCSDQQWSCADVEILGIDSGTFTFISEAHMGNTSWLDHVLATHAARQAITGVVVDYDTYWSDHLPLIVKFNFNFIHSSVMPVKQDASKNVVWGIRSDNQIDLFTKECWGRLRRIDFPEDCLKCADHFCDDHDHRRVLDGLYSDIVSALQGASKRTVGRAGVRKEGSDSHIRGWNKHVSGVHRAARTKFGEWVMCGKPKSGVIFKEMCESRRVFKSRLKWLQNHQDQVNMDAIAVKHSKGDFRGFWKSTKRLNVRPGLPVSVDGVSKPRDIANLFREQFNIKPLLDPAVEVLKAERNGRSVGIRFLASDVSKVIKSMSRGKSPGHDGLSIEHLQHAGSHLARVLAMFFSLCVSHSYLPDELMKTLVVPIVKNKTGDLTDKGNYRPISLATVIAKVFDGLLNTRLNEYVSIHDNQFGFRPHVSTESAILCLKQTVKYYTDRKTPVYACFLDLSKAFDRVEYKLLWDKLKGVNLPPELVTMFQYWYGHQSNVVRWAGSVSEPYRLECGVRQGGLTSPTLFNLYVNDLIVALSSRRVGCHIDGICVNNLSYADDMVLLSASICGLRKMMRVCEEYAYGHGLLYNVSKSQFMVFETAGARCPSSIPPVTLNGVALERVNQFKYLGHILTVNLTDHADMERERRAMSVRANMIARRFARCSEEVRVTLFRAYCTSLYTCSLWATYTAKAYSALRVQFNNAFRAVMGLPRFCSASGMFAQYRVDCFHATMRKRATSLVRRVWASSNTVLAMVARRLDGYYVQHCCNRHLPTEKPARKY